MLPITTGVYDFRTDLRTETFTPTTGPGVNTATFVLLKPIFEADTSTVSYASNESTETPHLSSYNATTRQMVVDNLTASVTRSLDVSFDVDALNTSDAVSAVIDVVAVIWLLSIIAFPIGALAALWFV